MKYNMISTEIQQTEVLSLFCQPVVNLTIDILKDIPLQRYPADKLHYLTYALQNGQKPPSIASMRRSQRRNQIKNGANKAMNITGRIRPTSRAIPFYLPNKYYPIPEKRRFVAKSRQAMKPLNPKHRMGRVVPKTPVSLPKQKEVKTVSRKLPKTRKNAARALSPGWIALKAERKKFMAEIQQYRKTQKNYQKKVPEYFRKKKANQKRRRQQKHLLIKANRKALSEIFGQAIFRRGWPVSRRQIKLALGIKEEDHMKPEYLGEFLQMAESKRVKQTPKHGEVSRKIRIVSTDLSKSTKQDQSSKIYIADLGNPLIPIVDDSEFPSLLNSKPSSNAKSSRRK